MRKIINFLVSNSLFVNLFFVGITITGILFVMNAQREAFPRIDFDYVLISTIYPGATAEDIEKHVTIPIEDQLREVDGIDEISSDSLEARSIVVVKLDADLPNKDRTINDIQNAVDKVDDFPDDVQDPDVKELSMSQMPVVEISIINKNDIRSDEDEFELRKYAGILEERILEVDGVAGISKQGYRDREMKVEVYPERLDRYHVAVNEVIRALSQKNINFPGGVIRDETGEVMVRTIGEVENVEDIRNVFIRANEMGYWVNVADVADVRDTFEEYQIINSTNSKRSITLTVLKKESADIISLVEKTQAVLDDVKKITPEELEFVVYNDMSFYVKRRLDVLVGNGIFGFTFVAIALLVFYGWRISIFTALAIPFAFFLTIIWMGINGVTINLMSMFGLIMALGMLVDNNIVVSDNIYRHMEEGWSIRKAVVNGSVEVLKPVAGTVLTTIAAFAPLMFMTGIMGKFIWTLPAVLTVALIASWIESAFVLPSQIYGMQKRRKTKVTLKEEEGGEIFKFLRDKYSSALQAVLRRKLIFIVSVTFLFVGSIVFGYFKVNFILFPPGGIEIFTIKAEAPVGISVDEMNRRLSRIEERLAELPADELDYFTSRAGIIQEEPNDPFTRIGSNYGIIFAYLTPDQDRERDVSEIIEEVRTKTDDIPGFEKLEFSPIQTGPPQGKPVSVSIRGDDFDVLNEIAEKYKSYLSEQQGVRDITDNFESGKDEFRIKVRDKQAAIAGVSVFDIASTVRTGYEGNVATTIKRTDETIDIRVILPEEKRMRRDSLKGMKIANRMGNLVPLEAVAYFEEGTGISAINRKEWRRSIDVSAEIDETMRDVTPLSVNLAMIREFEDIQNLYPGYTVNYEGEFRDTEESMADLARSFLIAAMAIYIILTALFRSLLYPIVIMGVIPLTFISLIWNFYFHGLPLSFLAVMGIVGLAGVVVNNSIVFMDFINNGRARGLSAFQASIEAGEKRLRPIMLSSLTTIFGLLPTAYGLGGLDPFLVPMALSMMWGLAFGTLITLFATPVLYNILTDFRYRFIGPDRFAEPEDYDESDFIFEEDAEKIMRMVSGELKHDIKSDVKSELEKRFEEIKKPDRRKK